MDKYTDSLIFESFVEGCNDIAELKKEMLFLWAELQIERQTTSFLQQQIKRREYPVRVLRLPNFVGAKNNA